MQITLKSPLFTSWSEQYVKLPLPGVTPGQPLALTIEGQQTPFQYTGESRGDGAEIILRLGFGEGETKQLVFSKSVTSDTCLTPTAIELAHGATIGVPGRSLHLPAPATRIEAVQMEQHVANLTVVDGPFASFAGLPMRSRIRAEAAFAGATLTRGSDGPLFTDYSLVYRFADHRHYTLRLRCYRHEPIVEVHERYALQMNGELIWTLNPERRFDRILSRESFEGETQPLDAPLGEEHPRDVLCRLQMPVLSEYFVPNNRGWFAFYNSRDESQPMLGILGLYGGLWQRPVDGMPELLDREGTVEWHSSLASGARYWLLHTGPVEKQYTAERRLVYHRLHAEFNALRLDEHLDLTGDHLYDRGLDERPGFFGAGDFHAAARERAAKLSPLQRYLREGDAWAKQNAGGHTAITRALLDPTPANHQAVYAYLEKRFVKWVRQFQGWRTAENDYSKNVIGFTRYLRGMLIGYELLRRDRALTDEQVGRCNAWFAFAARRITDLGRWPHTRSALHPDHPESTRDIYGYGGEHKPDRLYWTNSLPNFQSDPMCALAQLSAVFPDHPEAEDWRRLALDDIEGQLDAYCGDSGAWEESINYALYTMSYFVITFKALKEHLGIDYFQDERVRRFIHWLVRFLGPKDKRWDKYTWPAIGNSVLPTGGGEYLLCYAGQLAADDPLRAELIAVYQKLEPNIAPGEHYPTVMAALAPVPDRLYALPRLDSEVMDEVGVAMRHDHQSPTESYLFQKIGFAKDHYEADETAFNWYAKGTPLTMDYGTYTGDIGIGAAHNTIDIPDLDNLRRGYLASHLFSPAVDYTHCEMPVTLKLLWGRVRTFDEVDGKDGIIDRNKTPYFYIGDRNPVGPKTWKTRLLLFVKPDYIALFDRIYGDVPHRYCLHLAADDLQRDGAMLRATGRFGLDLLGFVQHPAAFDHETGETIPNYNREADPDAKLKHAQKWFRLYNRTDGIYRTLLFAREHGRNVRLEPLGEHGMRVVTAEYEDLIFLHNDPIRFELADGIAFTGRAGWLRRTADGQIQATMLRGERIAGFGHTFAGLGPWTYNTDRPGEVVLKDGPPRPVVHTTA